MAKSAFRSQSSSKLSSAKVPPNPVNRDRILAESVRKELHQMTFFTDFTVNLYKPGHVITGKPNSWQEFRNFDAEEDGELIDSIKKGRQVPREKYPVPQTSSQEIGWLTKPLIEPLDRIDFRLNHARRTTDATRFQEEMSHFVKPKMLSAGRLSRSDKGHSLHD